MDPLDVLISESFGVLQRLLADQAFLELCADIGSEPEWLTAARSVVAKTKRLNYLPLPTKLEGTTQQ